MNNFSDSLLELLLSWIKSIFIDVWNLLSGDNGTFFAWLGKHWLSLVCVLLLSGITIDLIIYILRWHPQRVWMSKFKRIFSRSSEEETTFDNGYVDGIESFELDSDPVISEYINAAPNLEQFDAGIQQLPVSEIHEDPPSAPVRHRRSDRHAKHHTRKRLISIKLPKLDESEALYSAYPAPPVQAREAFHNAVYPSDNQPVWQQGNDSNNANT